MVTLDLTTLILGIALGLPIAKLINIIIFDIILAKFLPKQFGKRKLLQG